VLNATQEKLLIVDSDEEALIAMERLLEDKDYESTAVSSRGRIGSLVRDRIRSPILKEYLSNTDPFGYMT
jgi:hypothetical protein